MLFRSQSNFTADLSPAERAAFDAATPNRFAYKHAHSQQNPEQDWGLHTLLAVEFAYRMLNQQFAAGAARFTPSNTLVIASSASNGAGAAIAAAEQDEQGLISGVAVSEPQIQPRHEPGLLIQRGTETPFAGGGKPLYDYFTLADLLQPCAALSPSVTASPFLIAINPTAAANRCAALKTRGLLTSTATSAQADEALALLHKAGWQPESDLLHASMYGTAAVPAVTLTYANAYGRFSVTDNLCGYSFAAISATGAPAPVAPSAVAQIFASGNGVPPTGGIDIINNDSVGGPLLDALSLSPSSGVADYNADGAFCLRSLYTGHSAQAARVADGIREVLRGGDLHGKPVLIVQGRSDTLVPVNFSSRYYLGLNHVVEGDRSRLRYYEITNANHFDAFIDLLPGYDTMLVPLHVYLIRALNLMYAHLKNGAQLPPSQVVYTVPRGGTPGAAPPITAANVPPIDPAPAPDHRITVDDRTVHIPE